MDTQLSSALLEILVCLVCHHPVEPRHEEANLEDAGPQGLPANGLRREWLRCRGCGLCYPIQDGIPVMLEERATREP
jgi:uncharacterized protein YbaR (Trm112 family)